MRLGLEAFIDAIEPPDFAQGATRNGKLMVTAAVQDMTSVDTRRDVPADVGNSWVHCIAPSSRNVEMEVAPGSEPPHLVGTNFRAEETAYAVRQVNAEHVRDEKCFSCRTRRCVPTFVLSLPSPPCVEHGCL